MEFFKSAITGPVEIQPTRNCDDRGYFAELFRADRFSGDVGSFAFVQENESLSLQAGTIRGLHFQTNPMAQGKLVRCIAGAIFDVAVDLRSDSPTYRQWMSAELSASRGNQLWVPPGFAHGFCTLLPNTAVCYKVTAYYSPNHDKGMRWDDPAVAVVWPDIADPGTLSAKDRIQPLLAELPSMFAMKDAG